jgi:glycerol-3-phosphate acyltransferase PlsY
LAASDRYNWPVFLLSLTLTLVAGYFLGSIPTGYLVARSRGIDIRKVGSGNMGATNVFRTLGKGPGILVLLIDAIKGAASVLIAGHFWVPMSDTSPWVTALPMIAALSAVLGHNYTCWLAFKGGKGIATSAGVLAALVPVPFLITLAAWIVVFALSRYVSLASILAAAVLPVATALHHEPLPVVVLTLVLALLAIWKHKPNIERLMAGTENRIGRKKETTTAKPESGGGTP